MNPSVNALMGTRGPAGKSSLGNRAGDIIPKGYSKGQLQQYTPEQMQLFNQQFSHVGPDSYLSRLAGGDEELLRQSEAPAWRDFQTAQGQLGSRFSGMGMGSQRGSGFKNAAGQLGSDFAMQLQANRQNLMRQAIQDLMGYSNTLLGQRPYETDLFEKERKPKEQPFWKQALGFVSPLGGDIANGNLNNSKNFLSTLAML